MSLYEQLETRIAELEQKMRHMDKPPAPTTTVPNGDNSLAHDRDMGMAPARGSIVDCDFINVASCNTADIPGPIFGKPQNMTLLCRVCNGQMGGCVTSVSGIPHETRYSICQICEEKPADKPTVAASDPNPNNILYGNSWRCGLCGASGPISKKHDCPSRQPKTVQEPAVSDPQYRMLEVGEVIRDGDEWCQTENNNFWFPVTSMIGELVPGHNPKYYDRPYRRRIVPKEKAGTVQESAGESLKKLDPIADNRAAIDALHDVILNSDGYEVSEIGDTEIIALDVLNAIKAGDVPGIYAATEYDEILQEQLNKIIAVEKQRDDLKQRLADAEKRNEANMVDIRRAQDAYLNGCDARWISGKSAVESLITERDELKKDSETFFNDWKAAAADFTDANRLCEERIKEIVQLKAKVEELKLDYHHLVELHKEHDKQRNAELAELKEMVEEERRTALRQARLFAAGETQLRSKMEDLTEENARLREFHACFKPHEQYTDILCSVDRGNEGGGIASKWLAAMPKGENT